ncbi:MAG: hypothetical protein PHY47_00290 [Lachnospiraceae bacterium]|nr:hypothetical protein [Lachnospiraceae bacterium]
MPVGTISLKYTTKKFPINKTFDTRINIKDNVEQLRFSTVFSEDAVGISFIDAPRISIEDNVLIKEPISSIAQNNKASAIESQYLTDDFAINFASFYITDIVNEVEGEKVPLYFWHDLTPRPNISNLQILDGSKNPVNSNLWRYENESNSLGYLRSGIYTNLQCIVDRKEGAYEVFYIRYYDNDRNEMLTELLDSKPFYSQSSFINARTSREYVLSQTTSGYRINVVFDSMNYSPTPLVGSQRFFIKNREKSKISIEKPSATLSVQRWNLRISPGDFLAEGRRYWIPEYYTQLYSPNFPYKIEKEREVELFDRDIVYTNLFPIASLQIEGFFVYILFRDSTGAVVKAITNDPLADTYITKQGFVTNIFYDKDGIESISANSGFIKLKEKVSENYKVYMSYRYIENYFTYLDLSVNPSINPDILGKRMVLYVIPDAEERAAHHLVVDESGTILESSLTDLNKSFEGVADSGSTEYIEDLNLPEEDYFSHFELEILSGFNSGIRVKISSYNNHRLYFEDQMSFPVEKGTHYRILKKIDSYTHFDPTLNKTYSYTGWNDIAYANQYIKLGDVFVIQNLTISDIKSYDSRIHGGGLKDEKEDAGLQLQDEARWYWDIGNFDGTPYPGMGAILVELPRYILKELGGPFERKQVREIVLRHMGAGSYPVIKYYDYSTEITKVTPGDKEVLVEWDLIDASEYNIYIGNSPDNLFFYQSQPGTRTSAKVTGLENNKIYYIQIEPIVGGVARLRSRIMSFMPFNYSNTLPPVKYGEGIFATGSYE